MPLLIHFRSVVLSSLVKRRIIPAWSKGQGVVSIMTEPDLRTWTSVGNVPIDGRIV
jgi:hypothetical protein